MPALAQPTIATLNQTFIFMETEMEQTIRKYMQSYEAPFWAARGIGEFAFTLGQGYIKNYMVAHGAPAPQQSRDSLWQKVRRSGVEGDYKPKSAHSSFDSCPPGTFDETRNSCVPEPKAKIRWGFTRKEFEPYESVLDTDYFCLKDLQHDWQIEQQVAHILSNLRDAISGHAENWNRDTYLSFCRVLPAIPNFFAHEGATLGEFPDVGLNPGNLSQRLLDELYELLVHEWREKAIGMDNGMPVFGLITSDRDTEFIMKEDPAYREDMRYVQDPALMKRYGANRLFRNYLHMYDPALPRFVFDSNEPSGIRRVYRWTESAATLGYKNNTNMEYLNAPLACSMVYMKDVFENGKLSYKSNVGGMGGDGVDVLQEAQLHWLNIKDVVHNPLGNMGKYLVEFTRAPKPGVKPAFAWLHRRAGFMTSFRYSSTGCPPTVDSCGTTVTGNVSTFTQTVDQGVAVTTTAAVSGVVVGSFVWVYFTDGHRLQAEVTAASGANYTITWNTVANPVDLTVTDHGTMHAVVKA